jgi:hypothetical protein
VVCVCYNCDLWVQYTLNEYEKQLTEEINEKRYYDPKRKNNVGKTYTVTVFLFNLKKLAATEE